MGYTIRDRDTGRTTYTKDVQTDGEFIKTDRGHIYHGRNVDVEKVCFVATASGADPETLATLRFFRDAVLKSSALGRLFIAVYYQVGPSCASVISRRYWLRKIVKQLIVDPAARFAHRYLKHQQGEGQEAEDKAPNTGVRADC